MKIKKIVPENNGKQNPKESCTNKYQDHIACIYEYKLVCVDDKISHPFKKHLGKDPIDPIYNFINSMIEESKYYSEIMKKHFNK